jgi:hypothetical protein
VFPEEYESVVTEQTLLLFEVLDFGLFSISRGMQKGFAPIAWGFLLPVSSGGGGTNTGTEIRLQLFKYTTATATTTARAAGSSSPGVYLCWKKKRKEYPASLFVTITPKARPKAEDLVPVIRPTTLGQT